MYSPINVVLGHAPADERKLPPPDEATATTVANTTIESSIIEIAGRCPVHLTLENDQKIITKEV